VSKATSRPEPAEVGQHNRRTHGSQLARWLLVAAATLGLAASMPMLPSSWQSITHLGLMSNTGSGDHGQLVIEKCSPSTLPFTWTCSGSHVSLVNDFRHHEKGELFDVATTPGSNRAYLWGDGQVLRAIAYWGGFTILCMTIVIAGYRRRSPNLALLAMLTAAGVTGLALALALAPSAQEAPDWGPPSRPGPATPGG